MLRWIVIIAMAGTVVGTGAYLLGPGVVPRSRLELLAFEAGGQFSADASLAVPDSTAGSEVRYPLILAIRNSGSRAEAPQVLSLALPGWARLLGQNGMELKSTDEGEELLHAYHFDLAGEMVEPEAIPVVIAGLEGIALVARLPDATCSIRWDGVPEFAKMPGYDPALLSNVEAFYTFTTRRGRESGMLKLRINASSVVSGRNAVFEVGPTEINRPSVRLPSTGPVTFEGRRTSTCGAPELRYEIESAVWRTGASGNGRLIIVSHELQPRRWLFDLDGDGRIELEAWDGDGDGQAEAKRSASYRIPSFLIPLPVERPAPDTMTPPAPTSADTQSAGANATAIPGDSIRRAAARDSARRDSVRRDSIRRDSVRKDSVRKDSIRRDSSLRDTTALDTLRVDTVGIDTTGVDTTAIDTIRIDTTGVDTTAIDTIRIDTTGVDTIAIDTTGVDTIAIDTLGARMSWVEPAGSVSRPGFRRPASRARG